MAHYAGGVFFLGDENSMEGPEYLYNTAPFWAALAALSCGAGAVMYTEPLWLGATSSPYSPGEWEALATVAMASQALYSGAISRRGADATPAPPP